MSKIERNPLMAIFGAGSDDTILSNDVYGVIALTTLFDKTVDVCNLLFGFYLC